MICSNETSTKRLIVPINVKITNQTKEFNEIFVHSHRFGNDIEFN